MKRLVYLAFCLLCLTTFIHANIIVQVPPNTVRNISYWSPIWQSFTAEASEIQSISFVIGTMGPEFPDVPVTVELYEGEGIDGQSLGVSQLQFVETFEYQYYNTDDAWMEADFSEVVLTVGNTYTALLACPNMRYGVCGYFWNSTSADPYADGEGHFDGIPDRSQIDFLFKVTSIPEPCTLALLALGGLALRKRK